MPHKSLNACLTFCALIRLRRLYGFSAPFPPDKGGAIVECETAKGVDGPTVVCRQPLGIQSTPHREDSSWQLNRLTEFPLAADDGGENRAEARPISAVQLTSLSTSKVADASADRPDLLSMEIPQPDRSCRTSNTEQNSYRSLLTSQWEGVCSDHREFYST